MQFLRRRSGSGNSFRETFRNRKRSGSAEFLFTEIRNAYDPSSRFITTWQQLILACILFELLLVLYLVTFNIDSSPSLARFELIGMYLCELVFCADIYVQLNTGYYEDGNVLRDTRKSRIKYLKSLGFVLDLLALPPLSLLPVHMHHSVVFLEFHKFIRVRRLPELISNLDNIYARYFVPLKLAKVLGITLLTSHFVACGRFSFGYDTHHNDHWLPEAPDHEQRDRTKYLTSLFWAFGLLTGLLEGELPHTNAEFAFTIFVGLCGFSMFTYLCATFFMLSKCESGDSETAEARVNQFKHILAFHRVPDKLQAQAVEYLKRYYTQAEANDREAARLLCPSISSDIQIELLQDTVAQIPVFEGCDTHFIKAATSLLELISCPAHFVLFRAGDHGDAMYVVNSGVLYTVVNGVKVRELRKGSFFGEVAVLAKLPRSATMMTTTYSTLYRLSRFHVDKLLEGYPRYARLISQTVDKMLKKANTRDEDKISEIASAGMAPAQKKKRSILLQVMAMKTEQAVWRSKRSISSVVPDGIGSPLSSARSDASSIRRGGSDKKVVPSDAQSLVESEKLPEDSRIDVAPIKENGAKTSSTVDPVEPPASFSGSRPQSQKVHPSSDAHTPPRQVTMIGSPALLFGHNSLFRESKKKLELFRGSFFRKGKVGPDDGKPQDVIRGFYDQLPQTAPPPPPSKHWWAKLLLKRCIDAESRVRMVWLFCLQLALCYNWITIPLQLAFPLLDDHILAIAILNMVVDSLSWVDIYLNLNLSYSLNSEKIFEPVRSAKRYFKSWDFLLDLCCNWPCGIFDPSRFNSAVIRLPRLLRVWRLKGHFTEVENYTLMNSRKRLLFFGLILLMLYHIVACLHFSITHWEGFSHSEEAWIPSDDISMTQINSTYFMDIHGGIYKSNDPKVIGIGAMQYFRSLYYAANVLAALGKTIEPDSDRQYAVALGFMLSGFLITAIVVDNVQQRFTASAFEQKEFFATRTRIQLFLKRQNAPLPIHQRVNSFLDFWWSAHRGAIIQELLEELPTVIKHDIVKSICTPAVESLALLRVEAPFRASASNEVPEEVRSQLESILLDNLRFVLYGQGEIIYRLGDYAGGLYFVLEGRVSVMPDGGFPYIVPLGGFFGTAALHLHDVRSETMAEGNGGTIAVGYSEHVTAVSGCIVVYVSREHLLAMESIFPSLPISLHVLERKLQMCKVGRTSELETTRPGPPVSSPILQRAMLGPLAPVADSARIWCKLRTGLSWSTQTSFDPDSRFVGFWETWIFFAMTTQWLLVIYHTCFGVHVVETSTPSVYVHADTVTIILESSFVIDMYLQSRLGYYEYGNKVMDIDTIKAHYFRSTHFLVDMLAIIPLFVLNWLKRDVQSRVELLNINKLIRIYKAPSHLKSLEGNYVKLAKEFRLFKLVYYTFLASHLFGCIWFDFAANSSGLHSAFSSHEHSNATTYFGENAWLPGELLEDGDRSLQYFGSIFWAFGLMSASNTGELPKTVMQCLFSVVTMTGGFFLFAYVVGNFLDVIELEDSENREFVAKMSSLRHLLAHFKLPQHIQEKFKTYFFFKRFHSITQEHVLERVLPPSLLVDIRMFQLHPMIIKVAFLAGMEDSVTRMLVSLFTQILYVKDEYICHFGEEGSEMFFIFTGTLDILIPAALLVGPPAAPAPPSQTIAAAVSPPQRRTSISGGNISGLQKVNEITAGSYFGEAALFTNAPRNASVKAKTSCILYRLSRQSLELVFDRYPEWKKKVLRIVKIQQEQQRLTRQATEVQQESDAGSSRRRGMKRNLSRMDVLNSRAEGIEELLLAHTRGDKKKSLAFSIKQALQKYNLLQWLHDKSAPAVAKVCGLFALLVNGVEIQSRFYILWVRLTSVCTVFIAVFVPYRVAYDSLDRWNGIPVLLRIVECLCEFVFLLDIWFNFRVRANQAAMELYEQDHLVTYKRERFIWDFVAAFPLDHFIGCFVFKQENVILKKWLRLNRCLKMKNFVYYRNEIKRRSVSFEIDRVKTLWLLYSIAIFWTSCAYFAVAMHDGFGTEWQAWLPAEELAVPDPEPDVLMLRLFRGLAFATTAFVKKGKTFSPTKTLDFAFSILISFVGQLIMASMIGEMANVFILYIDNEVRFRKNHITAEHYLTRWKVSNTLKLRANAFLTSWWSSYAGVDYQMVFDDLPRSVRTEGILHIAEKPLLLLMERVFRPLARGTGKEDNSAAVAQGVMHSIAQNLRFEGYPRGENVIVEGSVCKAMYFVVRGYLFSKSASNPSLYHAGRFRMGDYFGENGILGHSVSLMTVTSIRASDLFALDSERLLEIIKAHSYFQLVYKLAQDVVRQKKSVNTPQSTSATAGPSENRKSAEKTLSIRRISAPVVGVRQSAAFSRDTAAQKLGVDASARISTFEAHLSKLLRVNNENEWDSAFRLFVEMILPNGTLNDLDGKPKHSASGEQEPENGSHSSAADPDSSFSIRTRRAQSIATTGSSSSATITSSFKVPDSSHATSRTSLESDASHQLNNDSGSIDVAKPYTTEHGSRHETPNNDGPQSNDVALAEAQKVRLRIATLRLQKVMYAGGNRHELLQEANVVAEDSDEDKEDGDDGDKKHKSGK
ncbi:hypothetical protein Gpo141_00010304 [Globisporangium polare]